MKYKIGFITAFSTIFIFLSCNSRLHATHLIGGEITYSNIDSLNKVLRINATLYYDKSSSINFPNSIQIKELGGSLSINLLMSGAQNIFSPICGDTIRMANYTGLFYYSNFNKNVVTLYFSECCRTNGFKNVVGSGGTNFYLPIALVRPDLSSNFTGSPVFLSRSNYIIQANQTSQINFAANNVNGDSLYYDFVNVRSFTNNNPIPVIYPAGFSFDNPFDSNTVTHLDPYSGLLTVVNPLVGAYSIVVRVTSFRNGSINGRAFKEMKINVMGQPTNTYKPTISIDSVFSSLGQTIADSTLIVKTVEGSPLNIYFSGGSIHPANAPNPQLSLEISTSVNLLASTNGGTCNSPDCISLSGNLQNLSVVSGNLSFTPPVGFVHASRTSQFVTLTVYTKVPDWCGGYRHAYKNIIIEVGRSSILVNPTPLICVGDTIQALVTGDTTNLVWSPTIGVSNPNSAKPLLYPTVSTVYNITNLNDNLVIQLSVIVKKDSIGRQLYLDGTTIRQNNISLGQNMPGNWYYNNLRIKQGSFTLEAINGLFYNISPDGSSCERKSDTIFYHNSKQSALVSYLIDSLHYLPNVDSVSFILEGTGTDQYNTINKIYIVLEKFNYLGSNNLGCIITDLATNQIVRTAVVSTDLERTRHTIGTPLLQLPLTPTSKYKVKIYNSTTTIGDYTFYKKTNTPFVDSKGVYKITQSIVRVANTAYTNLFLPLVLEFENTILGEEEWSASPKVSVYPNPAREILTFQIGQLRAVNISIFDVSGKLLFTDLVNESTDIDISSWSPGMYIYQVGNGNNTIRGKVIKL